MQTARNLTYEPRGEKAQEYIEGLGKLAEPLAAVGPMPEILGATSAASMRPKISKNPEISIDTELGRELTPKASPVKIVPGAKKTEDIDLAKEMGGKAREFAENPDKPEFAENILKSGTLVVDPIARQAVKQGIDKGLVSMVKTSSKETRDKMAAMLNIVKRGKRDLRYQDRHRPWDIAGKSLEGRVSFIRDVNRKAGKEVSEASKNLAGKTIDYSQSLDSFTDDLGDHGVIFSRNDEGKLIPTFESSTFRASPKPKRIIRELVSMLDTEGPVDARQAHISKKVIDELVDWGKNATGGAGQVEGLAKRLRGKINAELGEVSSEYKKANQKYSETVNALDDLARASGSKLSIGQEGYNQAVGTGLRRLLSNAQSKSQLVKAIDDLESLSKKYGATFPDDIRDQVSFANQLDAIFGPSAKTSLAGETGKVIDRGVEAALGQKTLPGLVAEGTSGALKRIRGVNEENALKALEQLIRADY
jgi:hypothetical protein